MSRRTFIDAKIDERCVAEIVLRDGSLAQCGRHKKDGDLCMQHAAIKDRIVTLPTNELRRTRPYETGQRLRWAVDELLRRSRYA